jgi:hypothetical protein
MSLANDVLALHEGIIEAIIVEERSGEHAVVDHATRNNSTHSLTFGAKHDQLVLPELILGVATQFRRGLVPPKIVAVSYGDIGVLFCHLTENRALVIAAYSESLSKVMELTEEYLQRLAERERAGVDLINSATEAEQTVRHYLAKRGVNGKVSVDNVEHRKLDNRWVVNGSWPGAYWRGTKRYSVEVDAATGSILKFGSASGSRSALRVLGFVSLSAGLVALALLAYLLYVLYVK